MLNKYKLNNQNKLLILIYNLNHNYNLKLSLNLLINHNLILLIITTCINYNSDHIMYYNQKDHNMINWHNNIIVHYKELKITKLKLISYKHNYQNLNNN
jgi:hypothetical protein